MQEMESIPNSNSVSRLFSLGRIEIPQYQRSYSWERKEISQFLADVKEQNQKSLYLGQFLFEENAGFYSVIDGNSG